MNYGPGYTLWKQMLREREERRAARTQARRAKSEPVTPPAAEPPPRAKRPARGRRTSQPSLGNAGRPA